MSRRRRSAMLFTRGPAACATCHWVRGDGSTVSGVAVREADVTASNAAREQHADLPVPTLLLPDGRVIVWPGPDTLDALFGDTVRHSA